MNPAEVERVTYCYVHGQTHPDGDSPDDLPCREEEWEVVVLDDSEVKTVGEEPVQTVNSGFYTLKAGDLAYVETMRGGLVPCKVLSVSDTGEAKIRVTAQRLGWRRNSVETIQNPRFSLLNRNQVSRARGQFYVHGELAMVTDSGKLLR